MKKPLEYAFLAVGGLCLLVMAYSFFAPAYLPREPLPQLPPWEKIVELEPFEWRQPKEEDVADTLAQRSTVQRVRAWSLQIGELTADAARIGRLQAQLRGKGFNAYIRRYRHTEVLQYGLYIGPWLTLERLQQARIRLNEAEVIKSTVKVVPYSVYEEQPPAESTGISGP